MTSHAVSLRRSSEWLVTLCAVLIVGVSGCSETVTSPERSLVDAANLDEAEPAEPKPMPDGEFTEADENMNGTICTKVTRSGQTLTRDDNQNTPSQICPPGWEITGKAPQTPKLPEGVGEVDENGNKIVCWKETKPGVYIAKDDNFETPSQPCPPGYLTNTSTKKGQVSAKDLSDVDDNDNGVVCLKINESTGNFIAKDDNLNTPSQPCPPAYAVEQPGKKKK